MTDDEQGSGGFWTVHSGLEREAPGSAASTRQALSLTGLDGPISVIDVGCGPGTQTLTLAESLPEARFLAVDLHEPFVDEVRRRAAAAGVADRITAVVGDMADLPALADAAGFDHPVDLIWSEGAAYIIGFRDALAAWRPVLRAGGRLALTEAVWLAPTVPRVVREFWDVAYPGMQPVQVRRAQALHAGYRRIGDFTLPTQDWDAYYDPIRRRLDALRDDPALTDVIAAEDQEIAVYDAGGATTVGYQFFVLRRDERA